MIKRFIWLGLVIGLLTLAQFTPTTSAATAQSTIPPIPVDLTILVGPIDAIGEDEWSVAGVPVQITEETRINERFDEGDPGDWARVEGVPDGEGGLVAHRIKIVPQRPFVLIWGELDELTETTVDVAGIDLARTATTLVVGDPQPGDRVLVAAALQTDGTLLALQVRRAGSSMGGGGDVDTPPVTGKIELTGVLQNRPQDGPWTISGIAVHVTDETEIAERFGPLIENAWVQVEGTASGDGGILAEEIKSMVTLPFHKLEGTLDSLDESAGVIVVDGIEIAIDASAQIEGTPTPGEPVEIRAQLQEDGTLLATHVEARGQSNPPGEGTSVDFVGQVQRMPPVGLNGRWQIEDRNVIVTPATLIYEDKATIEMGAYVQVKAIQRGNVLLAAEIIGLPGE